MYNRVRQKEVMIVQSKTMDMSVHLYFEGKTIKDFLQFYAISKSNIYKLEVDKKLTINGHFERFDYQLKESDQISIDFKDIYTTTIKPHKGKIDILYEDLDIVILNKPPFLLVHPDGNTEDTLANRVLYHYEKQGYPFPVLPVHRIDLETSGMVIFSKHGLAHSYLSSLFESHDIKKTYVCLCMHPFKESSGVIDKKIGKDRHASKQVISPAGKDAITKYQVIHTEGKISKVEAEIIGGRKHQIRVHMASISHPLLGDKLYGSNQASDRCMLHFKKVSFVHPRTMKTETYYCPETF